MSKGDLTSNIASVWSSEEGQGNRVLVYCSQGLTHHMDALGSFLKTVPSTDVIVSRTPLEVFEALSKRSYPLALLDLSGMDPFEGELFVERLKGMAPETSIVALLDSPAVDQVVRLMKLGVEDLITWPLDQSVAHRAIQKALDRRALYVGDDRASRFMRLVSVVQLIAATLDEQRVHDTIVSFLDRETRCQAVGLFRFAENPKDGDSRFIPVATGAERSVEVADVALECATDIREMESSRTLIRRHAATGLSPELWIFGYHGAKGGAYYVVCVSPNARLGPGQETLRSFEEVAGLFKILQSQAQLTGRNIASYVGVKDLVYKDDATGLYNSRFLSIAMQQALDHYKQSGKGFSLLFLDVDHFKHVNDRHGHIVGTRILQEMGELIAKWTRGTDVLFRYGGDEFIILLGQTEIEEAVGIAERIRSSVEQRSFLVDQGLNLKVTVSIGVAACPEHAQSQADVIAAADHAMYQAKRAQRNFVYRFKKEDKGQVA